MTLSRESFYRKPGFNEKLEYLTSKEKNVINSIVVGARYSQRITASMIYYALTQLVLKYPTLLMTLEDTNEGRLNDLGSSLQLRPISKIIFDDNLIQSIVNEEESTELLYQKIIKPNQFEYNYMNGKALWKIYLLNQGNRIIIEANPTLIDYNLLLQLVNELSIFFNDYLSNSANGKSVISIKSFDLKQEYLSFKNVFNNLNNNLNIYSSDYLNVKLSTSTKLKIKSQKIVKFSKVLKTYNSSIYSKQLNYFKINYNNIVNDVYASHDVLLNYHYKTVNLDSTNSKLLLQKCSQNKIDLENLSICAIWYIIDKMFNIEKFITVEKSLNLRNFVKDKVKRKAFLDGNFQDYYKYILPSIDSLIDWKTLTKYQKYFNHCEEDYLTNLAIKESLIPPENLVTATVEDINENSTKEVFLTFLGSYNESPELENSYIQLENIDLLMANNVFRGSNIISVAGSPRNGLNFTIASSDPLVLAKFTEVSNNFLHLLNQLTL